MVTEAELRAAIHEQLQQQLPEVPGPKDNWIEAGMDSLEVIDVLLKLEAKFGHEIPVERFTSEMDTDSLIAFLQERWKES